MSTGSRSTARQDPAAGHPVSSFPFRRHGVTRDRSTSKPTPSALINEIRGYLDAWRAVRNPAR